MRASTAFLAGVGTVGLAISGGLGGGLVIGNMMSPSPPKHLAAAAVPAKASAPAPAPAEPPAAPPPMPAASALPYTAATLAFTAPPVDGRAPAPAAQQAASGQAQSPQTSVAAAETKTETGDAAPKPADNVAARPSTQEAQQQAAAAKPAARPDNAYAKARDADLRHDAEKHRVDRWAERRRRDQDQLLEQQARDDRGGRPAEPSYTYAERRYRDDGGDRDVARGDDDARAPVYYVDEPPRFAGPRVGILGPDD